MKKARFIMSLILMLTAGLFFNRIAFADNTEEIIPFGLNNPFSSPDSDVGSLEKCLKPNSSLKVKSSFVERHIEPDVLKRCLPNGVKHMDNINDIGINVISQHFPRRYCEYDCAKKKDRELPYFGLEEDSHRNHEIAVQLYINGFDNYFWAAIEPSSTKFFPGDITIIDAERRPYLPNSEEGFAEWQKWLSAMFDYLDAHAATDNLLYIQLGNESDGDYRKKTGADPQNRDDYHWLAHAKLIENSYKIIRERAPKAKIAIGTTGGNSVMIGGFQRPVLEYLSGKIDEEGKIVHREKRCDGTGCFDVYDYHDFSGYKDYREWEACRSRDCILKSPGYFRDLLNSSGFLDKGLVVQQGGTYTGQDNKINKEYQTEEDQSAYLVKRGVYLLSQGVEAIQSVTYIEHFGFHNTIHSWFTLMGLTYNGTPTPGEIPPYLPEPSQKIKNDYGNVCNKYPDKYKPWCEYRNNQNICDGQLPCPDPGKDIKKLSWFSQKKLIEILNDSDYLRLENVNTDVPNTFAYKLIKNDTQKPVYVVWWDWWKDYPRGENGVEGCKTTHKGNYADMDKCVNELDKDLMSKKIILHFSSARKIKVTESLPKHTVGAQVNDYNDSFNFYDINDKDDGVSDNNYTITLGKKPIYIEEIADNFPVACVVKSNQTVQAGALVLLDGSCSSDSDGDPLTYQWTQVAGAPVDLQNSNMSVSSFVAPGIIAIKNKRFSFIVAMVSPVVVEFFKSFFANGAENNNDDFDFQLVVSSNNKSSAVPAKVTIISPPVPVASISVTSPSNGNIISPNSKIEVRAKAKGENIKSVYFVVNGQKYRGLYNKREDFYFFNWNVPYGYSKSYDIEAQLTAYPVKKSEIIVKSKLITVYSSAAPTISVINIQNNQTIKPKQKIIVGAVFSPNDIGIAKVEFIITGNDKTKKQVDSNPNKEGIYSFVWTVPNVSKTSYQIQANGYTNTVDGKHVLASQSEVVTARVE